jgi:hypothetical protein
VGYKFDAFLSYSRKGQWPQFVDRLFKPMLEHWLLNELGWQPYIFHDTESMEVGRQWPEMLADALASSRIMIALWSKVYFSSRWCTAELGHMLARADCIRGNGTSPQLVLAAVIHDGDDFPEDVRNIQRLEIRDYANPWIIPYSEKGGELSERLRRFSVDVARAITTAPDHDPAWRGLETDRFVDALLKQRPEQRSVPNLGRAIA